MGLLESMLKNLWSRTVSLEYAAEPAYLTYTDNDLSCECDHIADVCIILCRWHVGRLACINLQGMLTLCSSSVIITESVCKSMPCSCSWVSSPRCGSPPSRMCPRYPTRSLHGSNPGSAEGGSQTQRALYQAQVNLHATAFLCHLLSANACCKGVYGHTQQ